MKQGHRTLKDRMKERLMDATGWLTSEALAEGLSTCQLAIDDALADLVIEDLAQFKVAVGYRLSASYLCRTALRELRSKNLKRAICARPFKDVYRVGVAEFQQGTGVVVYEIEMPMPPDGPHALEQHLRQVDAVLKFTQRDLAHG